VIGYTVVPVATFADGLAGGTNSDELTVRAAAGDRDALVAIYRAHFGELRSFAQRLLGCPMAADDLVHDVFEAVPAVLRNFRGECSLRNYLIAVAVRLAHGHLRSAKRRRALEERVCSLPSTEPSRPDADAEQRELAAILTVALDELPLEQRAAFILCEVEERSSAEAAEILGVLSGTVRARVFHAKRKLRERLRSLYSESSGKARP